MTNGGKLSVLTLPDMIRISVQKKKLRLVFEGVKAEIAEYERAMAMYEEPRDVTKICDLESRRDIASNNYFFEDDKFNRMYRIFMDQRNNGLEASHELNQI